MRHAVLLPPSTGQVGGGGGASWSSNDSDLGVARTTVVEALGRAMDVLDVEALQKLLDARGEKLEDARNLNRTVASAPTVAAISRYDGVLYDELSYATLPATARRRIDRSVLIFGALHGVATARDPLPEHRIGFGASLDGPGRLSSFWRPIITGHLARRLHGSVVWDLLPGEHAAAWNPSEVTMRRHIRVRFVDRNGRTVSHWNKLLKGALVAHLAREGFGDPTVLESFTHPSGYRWDPAATVVDGSRTDYIIRAGG